jgi:hypothetical protein
MSRLLSTESSFFGSLLMLVVAAVTALPAQSIGQTDEDTAIAQSLAAMLRSARTVISRHQSEINDPKLGNKGLEASRVIAEAIAIYRETTGEDAATIDPKSRRGRLLQAQIDAIADVMNANQETLNRKGVGLKGFIPATFARLTNEAFAKRAGDEAEVKVTAPLDLIRNRKALPDGWEAAVIRDKLQSRNWPRGQNFSAVAANHGRPAFRVAVPEYYAQSCLSCHGKPKGQIDITNYPKEGGSEGELGGVISITLYH